MKNTTIGIFKCIKCELVFTKIPLAQGGWYLECPNYCVNEINYDNHPKYHAPHKLFKWLNHEQCIERKN